MKNLQVTLRRYNILHFYDSKLGTLFAAVEKIK